MSCALCGDKGVVVVNWADAPREFAVCLCPVGKSLRETQNAYTTDQVPRWRVWAAREGIDPDTMHLLEDVLTEAEQRASGFAEPPATHLDAVAAAARARRSRKGRL